MSNTNTGGSAFPTKRRVQRSGYLTDEYEPCGGMTLRDYFAAKVMQGFAACNDQWPTADAVAKNAYDWADAMLKARKQ